MCSFKLVVSLQLGLSEEQRRVRGRERALGSTQKGMEALVRGRQEEIEAKAREVGPTVNPGIPNLCLYT